MKLCRLPIFLALVALCACGPRDGSSPDSEISPDGPDFPVRPGDAGPEGSCQRLTDCPAEVSCGEVGDGCGGAISCGDCPEGMACAEGQCAPCDPIASCASAGLACGTIGDGCGRRLDCGACAQGEVCRDGACAFCAPATCGDRVGCGTFDDGCDGVIACGCPEGERCEAGRCEICEPLAICPANGCGEVDDGCGGTISCGECQGEGELCVAGRCQACIPRTAAHCAALGIGCGEVDDGCGGTISCGFCDAPNTCAHGTCACEPISCAAQDLACGEAYDGCGRFISCGPPCPEGESAAIRLLAGNITSGNRQSYDEGHGIRIFQGLKPDIALVQEFRYGDNSERARRAMVEKAFGARFFHRVEAMSAGNVIPNGVVSYFPIKDWGAIQDEYVGDTRDHVWARIDIPGERDLWVISVHFSTTAHKRQQSAAELALDLSTELSIPSGDFLVIGGDFNTNKRTDAALKKLKQWVVVGDDAQEPTDQAGVSGTNASRAKPYDALYVNEALRALQTRVVIPGARDISAHGLVFDSRVFTPLSAVSPILKGDSGAANMQHMAVIKDFALPR